MTNLGRFWKACAALGAYGQGVRLLALTGQRRSEVFGASWQEIDIGAKTWALPAARCKNGRQHSVPLADPAIAVLRWLAPALGELSGPVFEPQSFSRMKGELDGLLPEMPPGRCTISAARPRRGWRGWAFSRML